MNILRYFMTVLLLTPLAGITQPLHEERVHEHTSRDSVHIRHFTRAAAEFVLNECAPLVYDRYIVNKDYARISFKDVGDHLGLSSWEWDDDGFQTNQIGHPYQGSIFFNAFRSNGYSFYESSLAAFAGSYLWELAAENQAPAPNDFINTGFGGTVLGETTHKMADRLTHNNARGIQRQVNEVIALLMNPSGGLTRILNGEWGRPYGMYALQDTIPLIFEIDAGLRKYNVSDHNPLEDGHLGIYGRIRVEYGSPSVGRKIPFSHLSILVEGGQDDSSKVNIVSVYGSLYGWKVNWGRFNSDLSISANYEYINNVAFFYSGQSVRANLYTNFNLTSRLRLMTTVAAGPILLAAVPDGYLYEKRDYDYGPGVAFNAGVRLQIGRRFSYRCALRGGWMKTVSGNRSDYFLHAFTNEATLALFDGVSLGAEEGYFSMHGHYSDFPNVSKVYPYIRFCFKYQLNL